MFILCYTQLQRHRVRRQQQKNAAHRNLNARGSKSRKRHNISGGNKKEVKKGKKSRIFDNTQSSTTYCRRLLHIHIFRTCVISFKLRRAISAVFYQPIIAVIAVMRHFQVTNDRHIGFVCFRHSISTLLNKRP